MLFYIHHAGTEHRVRVESRQNRLFIAYNDGEEEEIDLAFHGNDCSLVYQNRVFAANISGNKSDYKAGLATGTLNFVVESEYKRIVNRLRGQSLDEENKIVAKMPGKIVKILTQPGDPVSNGDPIIVMEAMKMENEITAKIDGKVGKVLVKEGQAVESGELLVEIEV